jgi:hypothetical protein
MELVTLLLEEGREGFPVSTQNHRYLRFTHEKHFKMSQERVLQGESFSNDLFSIAE